MLKVKLGAVPNPDYAELDYRGSIEIAEHWVEVSTLEEASKACREFIEKMNLGSGNYSSGVVIDDNGTPIGYISYNGRIWSPDEAKQWGINLE